MAGYGHLIETRRMAAKMSREKLGKAIGQSAGTVRRFEEELGGVPSIPQVIALVMALPLSAEELLTAIGVPLTLTRAAKLPPALVEELARRDPAEWEGLLRLLRGSPTPTSFQQERTR